jgi:heme/copper-type cytochrome/quinol oxidase subunit 2
MLEFIDLLKETYTNLSIYLNEEFLKRLGITLVSPLEFISYTNHNNINDILDLKIYLSTELLNGPVFYVCNTKYEYIDYLYRLNITEPFHIKRQIDHTIYNYNVRFLDAGCYLLSYNYTTRFTILGLDFPFFRVGVTPTMKAIVSVHHYIFHYIISIVCFVTWFIILTINDYGFNWHYYLNQRRAGIIVPLNISLFYSIKYILKKYMFNNFFFISLLKKINNIINFFFKIELFRTIYFIFKNLQIILFLKIKVLFLKIDSNSEYFLKEYDIFNLNTKLMLDLSKKYYNNFYLVILYKAVFIRYIYFQYLLHYISINKNNFIFFNNKYTNLNYFNFIIFKIERNLLKVILSFLYFILKYIGESLLKKEYVWGFVAMFPFKHFEIVLIDKIILFRLINKIKKLTNDLYSQFIINSKFISINNNNFFRNFLKYNSKNKHNLIKKYKNKIFLYEYKNFIIKYFLKALVPFLLNLVPEKKKGDNKLSIFLKNYLIYELESREKHSTTLEVIWTIIPSIILCIIAIPSFILLYAIDGSPTFEIPMIIKVIGHQWYWEYQFLNKKNEQCKFDSYMLTEGNWSIIGPSKRYNTNLRLLDTNCWLKLPTNTTIKFLVTSVDVIHSWALPSFGIKVDGIPGRLNQVFCTIKYPGIFYGQCSELCGVNHGFMPIKVQVYEKTDYLYRLDLYEKIKNKIK